MEETPRSATSAAERPSCSLACAAWASAALFAVARRTASISAAMSGAPPEPEDARKAASRHHLAAGDDLEPDLLLGRLLSWEVKQLLHRVICDNVAAARRDDATSPAAPSTANGRD